MVSNAEIQQEKQSGNDLHALVIDSLPFPIFCRNTEGAIGLCNNAFSRAFSLEKEKIIGSRCDELFPDELSEVLMRRDKEIFESGLDQHYETTLVLGDHELHDVIIQKTAVFDDQGKITGITGSLIDVTERRKLEVLLQQAEEDKKVATTLLQKIRAGIVIVDHELKIIDSNIGFARMFGEENEELYETIPGLKGADLDMLVPEVVSKMFRAIIETGESRLERDIKFQNKLLSIGVMTIHKHKIVGAIIRDMSAPMLERAEIIERARQVNRKNMKTVQQIAFLLGENAAQTEELLNSIIESQKYEVDENE